MYEAGVGSGETFQRAEAELKSAKGRVQGLRSQLQLLNLNSSNIQNGNIFQRIPVVSPIAGSVQEINVKTGQFAEAQRPLFEIVITEDVYADLMVFEKDIFKYLYVVGNSFFIEAVKNYLSLLIYQVIEFYNFPYNLDKLRYEIARIYEIHRYLDILYKILHFHLYIQYNLNTHLAH